MYKIKSYLYSTKVAQFDQKVLKSRISAQPSLRHPMSGHTASIAYRTCVHLSHVYPALNQTARRPHISSSKSIVAGLVLPSLAELSYYIMRFP
jgi:hypothetical protein